MRQADGGVFRFEPRTWKFEVYIPMNFPNPHGHVFDQWGRDIVFDATGGQPYYGPSFSTKKYYPAMETNKAPQARRRAHASGRRRRAPLEPPLSRDDAGQHHRAQHDRVPGAPELQAERRRRRVSSRTEVEPILQSADENFRPVDAEVGPDGALYFARLAQPDHRAHAAQPARHVARSRCTAASIA